MVFEAVLVAIAYLAGSIPTGVLLARTSGVDVRSAGSGNIGATNVARTAGRTLGILTLLGDALKGVLPVVLARALDVGATVVGLVAIAAIAGHVFSVFLGFRGGKGVATGFGVLLALSPVAALVPLAVFVAVLAMRRIVSLASLGAAASAPLALWTFGAPAPVVVASFCIAGLIAFRHRENLERLVAGTEKPFRSRDASA